MIYKTNFDKKMYTNVKYNLLCWIVICDYIVLSVVITC